MTCCSWSYVLTSCSSSKTISFAHCIPTCLHTAWSIFNFPLRTVQVHSTVGALGEGEGRVLYLSWDVSYVRVPRCLFLEDCKASSQEGFLGVYYLIYLYVDSRMHLALLFVTLSCDNCESEDQHISSSRGVWCWLACEKAFGHRTPCSHSLLYPTPRGANAGDWSGALAGWIGRWLCWWTTST